MFLLEALMDILKGTSKFMPNTPCCQVIVCLVMCQLCHTKRDPPTIPYYELYECIQSGLNKRFLSSKYYNVPICFAMHEICHTKNDISFYYKVLICFTMDHMCHTKKGYISLLQGTHLFSCGSHVSY